MFSSSACVSAVSALLSILSTSPGAADVWFTVVVNVTGPATATAPAASALGIPDFIDEWVSAPYPDQLKDRPLIRDGLHALGGKTDAATFAALASAADPFFKRFRWLVIGAYYTTEAGFKDIGYIGNIARESDPGPSDEVKAALERELAKLGL